jgi:hypothetical protein
MEDMQTAGDEFLDEEEIFQDEYLAVEVIDAIVNSPLALDALERALEKRRKNRDYKRENIHPSNYLSGKAAP